MYVRDQHTESQLPLNRHGFNAASPLATFCDLLIKMMARNEAYDRKTVMAHS